MTPQATARVIRVNSDQVIKTYFTETMPKQCTCLYFGCVILAKAKIPFDFCFVVSFIYIDISVRSAILFISFPIP